MRFAIAGIVMLSLGASAWWAIRTQFELANRSQTEQAVAIGNILGSTSETMLADGEVASVRKLVTETAARYGLDKCRITLSDGTVAADSEVGRIDMKPLPESWPSQRHEQEIRFEGRKLAWRFPLTVPGRGTATLEITVNAETTKKTASMALQSGLGAIGVSSLIVLLLLHRTAMQKFRGVFAVRSALIEHHSGQSHPEALKVNPDWGLEAKAWNKLLDDASSENRRIAMQKINSSLNVTRGKDDLESACDTIPQGMILVDESLYAKYVNGAAAVLLNADREKMIGANVQDFIRDQRVIDALHTVSRGQAYRRTIVEVQRSDDAGGGVLRFIVRAARKEDSAVGVVLIEDVTQQRVADAARNMFVAQSTHELRAPLTNMKLYVEMALDEGQDNKEILTSSLNVINQEIRRLDRMVADILSVSEIEAGSLKLKKDDVQLDKLFADMESDYAARAEEKQIKLSFNLPQKMPTIQADRDKLFLGLHNLVDNALKYTPAGGSVKVNVAIEKTRMVVDVCDTGIGINETECEKVFEKFYRANDPRVAKATGSGLGLALARDVMRLHGGDITLHSQLNKGSTFTLTLPITEQP